MPDIAREQKRKLLIVGIPIGLLLLWLTFGSALVRLQSDAWWYSLDAKAAVVFYTPLKLRIVLFVIGSLVAFVVVFLNWRRALRANIIFESDPLFIDLLPAFRALHNSLRRALVPASVVISTVFGLTLSTLWESWLLNANAVPFGKADPIFALDYSWFVFELPLRQGVLSWLMGLIVVTMVGAGVIYYVVPLMAQAVRIPMKIQRIQGHVSALAGVFIVLLGLVVWYSRYESGTILSERFTGASYADLQGLSVRFFLAIVMVFCGIGVLVRRTYLMVGISVVATLAIQVVGVGLWPYLIQNYKVAPNELTLQTPYIRRALDATRYAYSLDKIENIDFDVQLQPTKAAIAQSQTTLDSMRLWDPDVLRLTVDNLQSLRDYFAFQDIDVDRYTINGRQLLIMLGARDLVSERLDESRKNWQNLRLQYTHGNGVVAVPVNQAGTSGQPKFLLSDIPPKGVSELALTQPRIYYSDSRDDAGAETDRYIFVRSKLPEFDYSVAGDGEHTWQGTGGIPISGTWQRMVYAYVFGDKDLLFTDALTEETRLLYRRNVRERASHIFPYLKWDNDPYITIVGGRLVWILDGYTTTDAIPYSALAQVGATTLNYIRNSVKLTIDAYTGDWNAYVVDPDDPIIQTYQKIYPGLLKPKDQVPSEVGAHFRYPEDLFLLQAFQLTLYHQLDKNPEAEAQKFFRFEDAWQVPEQAQSAGHTGPMSPYYVQMRLPNEEKDGFMLILPFNPKDRPNMIGWLAAHCDPDDYGRLQLFRFPRDKNINGPSQQEASFQTDMELSKQITLIGQVGSEVVHGNLLVVPIGQSVMYVKTLFLVSRQTGIRPLPELKLIILAYSNKIVFAESYDRALKLLTSTEPGPVPTTASSGVEGVLDPEAVGRALQLLEKGRKALGTGDWATYGETQKELEEILKRAAKAPAAGSGQ